MIDGPLAQLRELYDALPSINCKGLCQDSCGPIAMSNIEDVAVSAAGADIPPHDEAWAKYMREGTYRCPALGEDGRCTVYDARPFLCRLWGVSESLPCPYGCEPDPGYLSDGAGMLLMARAMLIGGDPAGQITSEADLERLGQVVEDPRFAEFIAEFMAPWRTKAGPHANGCSQQQQVQADQLEENRGHQLH